MRLQDKVAIVTGSASGIGQAIAVRFAREGAAVVVDYVGNPDAPSEVEKQISSFGGKTIAVAADVSKPGDVKNLIDRAVAAFGRLDIVVNNAGIEKKLDFVDYPLEELQKILAVNLVGPFLVSQAAARQMIKQEQGGRLINISSVHEDLPMPTNAAYCASKGGLRMLMRTIAVELAKDRITVNNIGPGAVFTPIDADVEAKPEMEKALMAEIPLNRWGKPDEIAGLAVFLASDEAAYITGSTYFIDGGMLRNSGKLLIRHSTPGAHLWPTAITTTLSLLTGPPRQGAHQAPIVFRRSGAPDGRVQIDELNQRIFGEAFDPGIEIVELQSFLFALHQLNDLAAHEIDRGDQHGHLMGIPEACRSLRERQSGLFQDGKSRQPCGIGASIAKDLDEMFNRARSPDAITGMLTTSTIARVNSQSKPPRIPSRSIDVSMISPGSGLLRLNGPFDRIASGSMASSRGAHSEMNVLGILVAVADAEGVDGDDDGLRPVAMRDARNQRRIGERRRIDCDLVGSGIEHRGGVVQGADAAADRKRDEELPGGAANDLEQSGALLIGCGNIEQHDFVGSSQAVGQRQLCRVAGVAQARKLHAFHHASSVHIQAGDDALSQHDD